MADGSSKRKRALPHDATEGDEGEAASQAKRFRSSFADTITVFAGDEKVPSTVHTEKLCARSKYFKAACQREWAEGQDKTVYIPEVSPETFDLYAIWAYFGKIDIEPLQEVEEDPGDYDDNSEEERQTWYDCTMALLRLHVAADYLGDEELKKRTIDALTSVIAARRKLHSLVEVLSYVWSATPPKAGLRKFVLDYVLSYAWDIYGWLREVESKVPRDFFVDLAIHHLKIPRSRLIKSQLQPLPARKHMYYDDYTPDA
ncbi:hypothetical protein LTR17_003368 [Elasticomyces elasticus]|nr:hypothetical protein LTR17_003368 [Elasticomyces elasticus]